MEKGLFIAIEGPDGCGKSTLINSLKQVFKDAVFTFEPGGTEFSNKVRTLIKESENISCETEMFLFCASRRDHIEKVIKPNLEMGKLIISDRYVFSSYVYQGMLGDIGLENVKQINEFAIEGVLPDLVVYLDCEKTYRVVAEDRLDIKTDEEYKIINEGFKKLSKNKRYNFFTIKTSENDKHQILEKVVNKIKEMING